MHNGGSSHNDDPNSNRDELFNNLKTLLTEHSQNIPLTVLEEKYKTRFKKSLLNELIQLCFPDAFNIYTVNTSEDKKTASSDQIIALKAKEHHDSANEQFLQRITASRIVPREFRYILNPFMTDKSFPAFVSYIDQSNQCIFVQPEIVLMQYNEKLINELNTYYSNQISEQLLVEDITPGLACVTKLEERYYRVFIKENHPLKCLIMYVDLGITMEINQNEIKLKHLLNYFAEPPCMTIASRLFGVEFKLESYQMTTEALNLLKSMYQNGPYIVEPHNRLDGILYVKIFDNRKQCLNDIIIQRGLGFSTMMSSMIDSENGKDQRETKSMTTPSQYAQQKSLDSIDKTDTTLKSSAVDPDYLSEDYENLDNTNTISNFPQQSIIKQSSTSHSQSDYKTKASLERSNSKTSTYSTNANKSKSTSRRDVQLNGKELKITVDAKNIGGRRLFRTAMASMNQNNNDNRRSDPSPVNIPIDPKTDDFSDWMCSWSTKDSLWLNDPYRNALLNYIGRIYNQRDFVYRIFANLKSRMLDFDELDLLKNMLESTREQGTAQTSLSKWEDSSRINRRVNDLRIIFEFNGNYSSASHGFKVSPPGLLKIVNRQKIQTYFDLGCGDGDITAGIGNYLGLTKENTLGGDVFEGQNKNITFIKIDENQSTIALEENSVDLITTFVTLHHVSQLEKILAEITRILRPGGYLILREHDCKNDRTFSVKYLNFVHAIMLIAEVGEFARSKNDSHSQNGQSSSYNDYETDDKNNWEEQKRQIIAHTKAIHYRSYDEWQDELKKFGFRLCATLSYDVQGADNPQKLFYGVFQLDKK